MDSLYNVKTRLTEALEMRDMTATELAKRSGVSKSNICRYMKGTIQPRPSALISMAEVLQVSPIWLLGLDVTEDSESVDVGIASNLEQQLKAKIIQTAGSVNKFAGICGLPQSTIASMLTRGVGRTSFNTITIVCKALNISIDGLLAGKITPMLVMEDMGIDISKLNKANFNRFVGYYQALIDSQV